MKFGDAVARGRARPGGGGPGVGGHGLQRVLLAHGHVLERGGVQDHVRAFAGSRSSAHAREVAHRGQDRHRPLAQGGRRLAMHVVERRLRAVQQDEAPAARPPRVRASCRTSSLPMLPPGSGDEDASCLRRTGCSSTAAISTVSRLRNVSSGTGTAWTMRGLAAQQRLERRHHAEVAHPAGQLGDPPQHARRRGGDGHDHLVDGPPPRDLGQVSRGAEDGPAQQRRRPACRGRRPRSRPPRPRGGSWP